MVECFRRFVLVALTALTFALSAAAESARAGGPLDWTLSGQCAEMRDSELTLSICGPSCGWTTTAVFVAPTQGTVLLQADYTLTGNTIFNELRVFAGGQLVGYMSAPCGANPCSGSITPIVAHLAAGQSLVITLEEPELLCGLGGTSTVNFHHVNFVPDVGFVTGAGALDGSVLATAQGSGANARLGEAVALLADIDGDGVGDAAASGNGTTSPDFVRFLSGATGATLFDVPDPAGGFLGFGESIAALGDLDGDGRTDLVVGAGTANGPARVLSGADGHVLLSIPAPAPNERFAVAVGAAGDLDGDDVPDVLVGAPFAQIGGTNSGAARAYSGATGALLLEVPGALGEQSGEAVASAGDVNGDGVPDLIVGVPLGDAAGPNTGAIRVHSGSDGTLLHELAGPGASSFYWGNTLGATGDLDGDGVGDVVGGDAFANVGGPNAGIARIFSGATGALLFDVVGNAYDGVGESACAAGDWDGDGRDDAAVSARAGYVLVISGATHAVLEQIVLGGIADAVAPNTGKPAICAGGLDVDGDGHSDFAVGLPGASFGSGFGNAGQVLFVSGNPSDHVAPTLTGTGALLPATQLRLRLAGGDALAPVYLIASGVRVNLPFKGGLLVPAPTAIVAFALNAAGAATLTTTWPSGIPSGASLWLQAWIADSDGPAGVVATAALQIIAP